jgi:hypothetical protein
MSAYFKSPNRVCAYTFKNEKDLPPGQKLKDCGKCREVCYLDRESQEAHWPIHKQVCCALEKDEDYIREGRGYMDIWQCLASIGSLLVTPQNHRFRGRRVLYAYQQLIRFLDNDLDLYVQNLDKITGILKYGVHSPLMNSLERDDVEGMWASPGFVNYFLSEDIFLTPAMKLRKDKNEKPPEQIVFETEMDGLREMTACRERQLYLTPATCGMLTSLFLSAASTFTSKTADGPFMYRYPTALSVAAARHFIGCWKCPYKRSCFPAGATGRNQALFTIFQASIDQSNEEGYERSSRIDQWKEKDEILPGLTAKEAAIAFITDKTLLDTLGKQYYVRILDFIFPFGDQKMEKTLTQGPWKSVSAADRIEVMNILCGVGWIVPFSYGQEYHNVTLSVWSWMLGHYKSTFLKVYELAVDTSKAPTAHSELIKMLQSTRVKALKDDLPRAQAYLDVLEPRYQAVMGALGYDPLPFPDAVLELIVEFSMTTECGRFTITLPF